MPLQFSSGSALQSSIDALVGQKNELERKAAELDAQAKNASQKYKQSELEVKKYLKNRIVRDVESGVFNHVIIREYLAREAKPELASLQLMEDVLRNKLYGIRQDGLYYLFMGKKQEDVRAVAAALEAALGLTLTTLTARRLITYVLNEDRSEALLARLLVLQAKDNEPAYDKTKLTDDDHFRIYAWEQI